MYEEQNIWTGASDALYNPKASLEILESFNKAIDGLYFLSEDDEYFFKTLGTSTYVDAEYKRLKQTIKMDLSDIANTLELMRNVLFGEALNWTYIESTLKTISEYKKVGKKNEL